MGINNVVALGILVIGVYNMFNRYLEHKESIEWHRSHYSEDEEE